MLSTLRFRRHFRAVTRSLPYLTRLPASCGQGGVEPRFAGNNSLSEGGQVPLIECSGRCAFRAHDQGRFSVRNR